MRVLSVSKRITSIPNPDKPEPKRVKEREKVAQKGQGKSPKRQ
jgi:hypothetical protein